MSAWRFSNGCPLCLRIVGEKDFTKGEERREGRRGGRGRWDIGKGEYT